MKITRLEILKVPPSWVWLKIHTDDGLYGLGEPYLENHPDSVIAEVMRLEEVLIGKDPRRVEELWRDMYNGFWYYKGGPVTMSAISGIDQALWDLKGKAAGLPVHAMLGGAVHDRILMYTGAIGGPVPDTFVEPGRAGSDMYQKLLPGPPLEPVDLEPALWAETTRYLVEELGYRVIKLHFKIGGDLSLSAVNKIDGVVAAVGAVRDAIGSEIDLAVDMSHLHPQVAIQVADALAPFRLIFMEDPQPIERIEALKKIAHHSRVPIAAGQSWMGKWAFLDAVNAGLSVVQPDLCHAGGITECKKIAAIAEAAYAKVAMHTPNSVLQLAATIQLHACLPNFLAQEQNPVNAWYENGTISYGNGYLKHPIVQGADGCVEVPTRPGLGVELDEDNLREIMKMPWRAGRA